MEVKLNKAEIDVLFEQDPSSEKNGGWQGLLVRLQRSVDTDTGVIKISGRDLVRIPKYAFDMGHGGWQGKLISIFGRTLGPKLGR